MVNSIEWLVQQHFQNHSTTLKDKVCTSFVGTWLGGANFTQVSPRNGANSPLFADINL